MLINYKGENGDLETLCGPMYHLTLAPTEAQVRKPVAIEE